MSGLRNASTSKQGVVSFRPFLVAKEEDFDNLDDLALVERANDDNDDFSSNNGLVFSP